MKRIDFVQQQTAGPYTKLVLTKSKTAVSSNCMNSGETPETYFELLYLMNVPTIKQSLMSNDNEKIHLIKRLLLIKIPS